MTSLLRKIIKDMLPHSVLTRRLGQRASNCVLLTFDDGPHPQITPQILDRLRAYEARAIFFIPGVRIKRAPHLLKRILEQGHVIGNHTYIHSNQQQPWFWDYYQDLQQCQAAIEEQTGKRPSLFRPAGGTISPTTLLAPRLVGLRTITWSLDPCDWRCRTLRDQHQAAQNILQHLSGGDIILLHDDKPNSIEILDIILPVMKSRKLDLHSGIDFLDNRRNSCSPRA